MAIEKDEKKEENSDSLAIDYFSQLIMNIHKLYDNEEGCPWHKDQTHESLIPYLIEENNELQNALLEGNKENISEELGDLLLQIMIHSEISSLNKEFDLKDVIQKLNKKILFRHPYIFNEKKKISIEQANKIWKAQKNLEKKNQKNELLTNLSFKIKKTNPIHFTQNIAFELDKLGFGWKNSDEILDKMIEEIKELKEAINKKNKKNIKEEFGDIFFTLINLSYFLNLNNEEALSSANRKFLKRIIAIEEIIGDRITKETVNDFRKIWKLAKKKLQSSKKIKNE